MRRFIKYVLIIVSASYLGLCGIYWLIQDDLIYPISHNGPQASLSECNLPQGTQAWNYGDQRGLFHTVGGRNLVVFFHGNGGTACNWRYLGGNHVAPLGFDTLVVEYPGYAADEGKPSEERMQDMMDEIQAWHATQSYKQTAVIGYSLGTGIASQIAERVDAKNLMLFAPYDRMDLVIRDTLPIFPKFLTHQNYDSVAALRSYLGNITIIHGDKDTTILPERSESLAAQVTAPVERIILPDNGHGGLFETKFFNALLERVL